MNMCAQCVFTCDCLDARVLVCDRCSVPKPLFMDVGLLAPLLQIACIDFQLLFWRLRKGGGGSGGGWGLQRLADLLAAYFAKENLFPRKGETNTQSWYKQAHEQPSLLHTHCKSPPAFGLIYTPAPTQKHKHMNKSQRCTDKLLCKEGCFLSLTL